MANKSVVTGAAGQQLAFRLRGLTSLEFLGDITFVPGTTVTLPNAGGIITSPLFWVGILIEFIGRLAVGGANATSEFADSPHGLIESVTMSGVHRLRLSQETFVNNIHGSDLAFLNAYQAGTLSPTTITQGSMGVGTGNKDIRSFYYVPFLPEGARWGQGMKYLLDAFNYDQLKLSINCGLGSSCYNPAGGTTFTYTAFGSGAGTPILRCHAVVANFGPNGAPHFVPGRSFLTYVENSDAALTNNQSNYRMFSVPKGAWIRMLMLKQGIKATTTAPGFNAWSTLQPVAYDGVSNVQNMRLVLGQNNPIRYIQDWFSMVAYNYRSRPTITPGSAQKAYGMQAGVGFIDFTEQGDLRTVLDTSTLTSGAQQADLALNADITGQAGQTFGMLVQDLRYTPQDLSALQIGQG